MSPDPMSRVEFGKIKWAAYVSTVTPLGGDVQQIPARIVPFWGIG